MSVQVDKKKADTKAKGSPKRGQNPVKRESIIRADSFMI